MAILEGKTEVDALQGQSYNKTARHGDQGELPMAMGKAVPSVFVAVVQGELVKEVLCRAGFQGLYLVQAGEMVPQLFDGLDLVVQVVMVQELTQVHISLGDGQAVQI